MSEDKPKVSRRQFLNYTLTGAGGFMAAGIVVPMLRMAIDPVLQPEAHGDYSNVNLSVDDITEEPQRVEWEIEQVDGWYKSDVKKTAWVYKDEDGNIMALSPICKHLGCTVTWEGSDDFPNEFFCPCHDGRYYKSGVNVPGTPPTAPLDMYKQKVEDGMLYLGEVIPHKEA